MLPKTGKMLGLALEIIAALIFFIAALDIALRINEATNFPIILPWAAGIPLLIAGYYIRYTNLKRLNASS